MRLSALLAITISQLLVAALPTDAPPDAPTSIPDINATDITWLEETSANGDPFLIGTPSNDTMTKRENGVKQPFSLGVSWQVWKSVHGPSASDLKNVAAITYALVYEWPYFRDAQGGDGRMYTWCLDFTNELHYNYWFQDEEGDVYNVNTFRNGDHFVCYNSKKPTIVRVSGR